MMRVLKSIYNLPPKVVLRRIRRRLSSEPKNVYCLEDVVESAKHMRPQRMFDYLSRYQAILKRHGDWVDLDFAGQRVLELGCGPLAGWAPMAVFLGCQAYTCVEPMFNPAVLESSTVVEKYLLPLHKDLRAIYGAGVEFNRFLEALRMKVAVFKEEFLAASVDGPFDIVLSNSCLEHVFPLDATLRRLREVCRDGARFIHLVDFGNHRATRNPFDGMYSVQPRDYYRKFGKHINLLRAPDVLACLRDAGFETALVPYYTFQEFYRENIHPYWSDRYGERDLFLKTGLFASL